MSGHETKKECMTREIRFLLLCTATHCLAADRNIWQGKPVWFCSPIDIHHLWHMKHNERGIPRLTLCPSTCHADKKYKMHSICAYLLCTCLSLVIHGKWQNERERERERDKLLLIWQLSCNSTCYKLVTNEVHHPDKLPNVVVEWLQYFGGPPTEISTQETDCLSGKRRGMFHYFPQFLRKYFGISS